MSAIRLGNNLVQRQEDGNIRVKNRKTRNEVVLTEKEFKKQADKFQQTRKDAVDFEFKKSDKKKNIILTSAGAAVLVLAGLTFRKQIGNGTRAIFTKNNWTGEEKSVKSFFKKLGSDAAEGFTSLFKRAEKAAENPVTK